MFEHTRGVSRADTLPGTKLAGRIPRICRATRIIPDTRTCDRENCNCGPTPNQITASLLHYVKILYVPLDFRFPQTTLVSRYHQHRISLILPPKQVCLGFPSFSKGLQASDIISEKRTRISSANLRAVLCLRSWRLVSEEDEGDEYEMQDGEYVLVEKS